MSQAAPEIVGLVARIELFYARPIRKHGPELAADMTELRRGQDLIELKFSEMVVAFAVTDEYDVQGSVSPIDWIRHNCHVGKGAAGDRVAVGEQLSSLPDISGAPVERLACDCNVTRILLGADSAVIDVGRSTRMIMPATRRALNVRDRGCRWPGCDWPASWTAGHHFVHWTKGGTTDLPNLVLLCHRHHWMVHEGKWQLVKTDAGKMHAIPPQFDMFRQLTRGPGVEAA